MNLDDLLAFPPTREGCPLITDNPTTKNFAPRLGLAWDLSGDGKTALRAGFGIFHGNLFPKEYQTPGQSQPPLATVISIRPGRGGFDDDLQLLLPGQPLLARPGIEVPDVPGDFRPINITQTPYSIQYSLSLQRELFTDGVVSLGYMGNQGVHMPRTAETNVSDSFQILPDGRLFFPNDDQRRNPLVGEARTSLYDGTSSYHSLIFGVSKRFSQGLQFQSSYTFSKGLDDSSGITNSFEAQGASIDASQPFFRDIDRGFSSFDIRHNFSFNFSADIPFGRTQRWGANSSGPVDAILGGWKLNGIWTLASGSPLSMRLGFNHSLSDAGRGVDRPNLVAGFSNNPTEGVTAGCTSGDTVIEAGRKLGDRDLYFDPCAFVLQEEGFLGDLGRNTAIGDAYLNFDFSLSKQSTLTEDVALEFRAEVFNLFNQTSLGFPDSDIFDDDDGTLVGSIGTIRETIADSRQIQFGLKLLF